MKTTTKYLLLASLMWLPNLAIAYVTIGTDGACTYQTNAVSIQTLIANGESDIRITNQAVVYESIQISKSVSIYGSYNNCTDARNLDRSSKQSTIDANNTGPVIKINSPNNGTALVVYLLGMKLSYGINQDSHHGGGVSVYDSNDNFIRVTIEDSLISNNTGNLGGGIYINGDNITTNIFSTIILNNKALGTSTGTALGGGVFCSNGTFSMQLDSGIHGNQASSTALNAGHGGGLYATNGCQATLSSGTTGGFFDFRGIASNLASSHGGGIYLSNGADVNANSSGIDSPINISSNLADSSHNGFGDGGGIYLTGAGTSLQSNGILLKSNEADNGGGAAVFAGALMSVVYNADCFSRKKCNQLTDNRTSTSAGKGGALYLNQGNSQIYNAYIDKNVADDGSVVYAGANSSLVLSRSIIHENGSGGADGWSDNTVYHFVGGDLIMSHITSALNQAVSATFKQSNGEHNITNSIFYEPVTDQFGDLVNASGIKDCLVVDNNTGIGVTVSDIFIGDAELTDNFHLSPGSMAIDRCFEILNNNANAEFDIDGEWAPEDYANIDNGGALLDIGADEFVSLLFSSSFE